MLKKLLFVFVSLMALVLLLQQQKVNDAERRLEAQQAQLNTLIREKTDVTRERAKTVALDSSSDSNKLELLRLRGEVGILRQELRERESHARPNNLKSQSREEQFVRDDEVLTPWSRGEFRPKGAWATRKRISPDATIETLLVSAREGDFNAFRAQISFPSNIANNDEDLSERIRAIMNTLGSLTGATLSSQEQESPATATIGLKLHDERNFERAMMINLTNTGSEWWVDLTKFLPEKHPSREAEIAALSNELNKSLRPVEVN